MKHSPTTFLRVVVLLIAIGVFTGLLWFPMTEGRATNLDLVSIYADPFIIYIYLASTPFFAGLHQALKLLGYIDKNKVFSQDSVKAIRNIKYCALSVIGFIIIALIYIRFMAKGDDPAGPTMMGLVAIFTSIVIASAAGISQKLLQKAVDLKSENDMTI